MCHGLIEEILMPQRCADNSKENEPTKKRNECLDKKFCNKIFAKIREEDFFSFLPTLGVPSMSRILTGDSQKLSFSILR